MSNISTQNEHSSNKNTKEKKISPIRTRHQEEAKNKVAKRSKNDWPLKI